MKKIWYVIVVFCLCAWFLSSSPDPVGTYVAKHHTNTIDTVLVLKGGIYKQSIYRKADGARLFHNEGKWSYQKGRIRFTNFFQSDDIDLAKRLEPFIYAFKNDTLSLYLKEKSIIV